MAVIAVGATVTLHMRGNVICALCPHPTSVISCMTDVGWGHKAQMTLPLMWRESLPWTLRVVLNSHYSIHAMYSYILYESKMHFMCRFVRNQVTISNSLHITRRQSDLMEFFDSKDNWAARNVKVGEINFDIMLRFKSSA